MEKKVIDYEAEVKKVHPHAIAKQWAAEGVRPFWVVSTSDYPMYDEKVNISGRCRRKRHAWQNAFERLKNQNKL